MRVYVFNFFKNDFSKAHSKNSVMTILSKNYLWYSFNDLPNIPHEFNYFQYSEYIASKYWKVSKSFVADEIV